MTPPDKDTREAFEAWARKAGFPIIYETKIQGRTYWNDGMEHCWRAWQAALNHRPKVSLSGLSAELFDLENEHRYPAERPQWKWLSSGIQEKRKKRTQAILNHLKQQGVQFHEQD